MLPLLIVLMSLLFKLIFMAMENRRSVGKTFHKKGREDYEYYKYIKLLSFDVTRDEICFEIGPNQIAIE